MGLAETAPSSALLVDRHELRPVSAGGLSLHLLRVWSHPGRNAVGVDSRRGSDESRFIRHVI